ncbi:DUF362 domain-containing protein [Natrarchaeobius halalkaliphilus]|uniref:DUF362 domain-containing protein n=1 Tax=Natrarchaeobius halalkaliphilus TaxID=1679091 RepID=A0A3N6LP95_9EURY|nr:DUF362 domain-containing protein [Natrarchaeobius halalkaliphilus]RQG91248.1 DUF362 domain-containing protein [Natrarchaeobius halalkaliphilus]
MTDDRVRVAAGTGLDHGGWRPDVDARMAVLEPPIRRLLDANTEALTEADRITLVPDVHYPFHPSTGMVTDPAVVGAIASYLRSRGDADLVVAGASGERIEFDRTLAYLGYPELLERFDAEPVDLVRDEPRTNEIVCVDGRSVPFSVPATLGESTVIVVPTLRPTEEGPVAGGMRTLAAADERTVDPDVTAVAATRVVDPVLSVLDATTAYGSDPHAANAIFAGSTPSVDAVGASLLEREIEDDRALELAFEDGPETITLERVGAGADRVDVEDIRERLGGGELPPTGTMHPAVTAAYRLYATVGRDAVPPQIEGEQ